FAKLIPGYMIVSKRKLLVLVNDKIVSGWDDPRMPTLSGLRRRGIPASALRRFVIGTGVTKHDSLTDIPAFDPAIREKLNPSALPRRALLLPIKVALTTLPPDQTI